jgi:hypothetical protein
MSLEDAPGSGDRQMPQMAFDIGEPCLRLQALAFLVAMDDVGQRPFRHDRYSCVVKPKYPHNPGYQDYYLSNQWEW